MVKQKTLLKNLFKNSPMESYAKYFYYGFEGEEWYEHPIGSYNNNWRNQHSVVSLNWANKMYERKLLDIVFIDKKKKDINLMIFKQKTKSKFALVLAGGGYVSVANAVESLPIAFELYKKEFSVAILTYSIRKDAYLDGSYIDLTNAIKYLEKNQNKHNVDMKNFILGGCSAGGHLAGRYVASENNYHILSLPKPGLLFLAYPVISMGKYAHLGSRDVLIGENPNQDNINKYSLENHVSSYTPPVFIWQCKRDNIVPIDNSILFAKSLKKNNIPFTFISYDSDVHGWGSGKGTLAKNWINEMVAYYKKVVDGK